MSASIVFISVTLPIAALNCQAPLERIDAVIERHERAIEKLPEEKRCKTSPARVLVEPAQAEELLPKDELTLEKAREIAVAANPDLHAARARLELALSRVAEARSLYYPNLTLSHSATRTFLTPANRNRLAAASALQANSSFPVDTNSPPAFIALLNALRRPLFNTEGDGDTNAFSEHSTALTSSWLLFDGFVREAQLMASKYVQRASTEGLFDVQRLLIQSLDAAYFQAQLAREQIRIAQAAEQFSNEQLEETRKLHQAGRASLADVDNFRVRLLAAQAEVRAAEGLHETGRVVLAELMGLAGSALPAELQLSPLIEETEEELTKPDAAEFLRAALENRPDVRQLEELVRAEEENVRAVFGLYYPIVSLSGSWGYNRTSNMRYEADDQSSAAGLELRWEIFNGGAREAQVRAAHSVLAEVTASLARQRLAAESQVRQAIIDVSISQDQIRLQRENLATARENRRIVQAGYTAGKETLTRLNETQRDFITTEANLALARIRLRQAWSDLRAAAAVD